jgi:hypothetical protein
MAIVALVLWAFTAAAGFYLLVTSNLSRHPTPPPVTAPVPQVPATAPASQAAAPDPARVPRAPTPEAAPTGPGAPASPRELRHAARTRWDPPSLVAAREAPMLPGLRSLLEFAHPAFAIIGLAFWLGFTLVHNKALGWIAFGLIAVTASLGLTWFTANLRAARRPGPGHGAPHFSGRLLVVHGSAAALTLILAAVTALVTRG